MTKELREEIWRLLAANHQTQYEKNSAKNRVIKLIESYATSLATQRVREALKEVKNYASRNNGRHFIDSEIYPGPHELSRDDGSTIFQIVNYLNQKIATLQEES